MGSTASKAARGSAAAARNFPASEPSTRQRLNGSKQGLREKSVRDSEDNGSSSSSASLSSLQREAPLPNQKTTPADITGWKRVEVMTGDFNHRLNRMGVAQPKPAYSPSSAIQKQFQLSGDEQSAQKQYLAANNATLTVVSARRALQDKAEDDHLYNTGRTEQQARRRFADMRTLTDALLMRESGIPSQTIEARLNLSPGTMRKLGSAELITYVPR